MKRDEAEIQKACVNWFNAQYSKYADLLHHSPNGGKRNTKTVIRKGVPITYSPEAAKFKAMGTKAGFPDLFLYVPKGKYHGLAIEMKSEKGATQKSQSKMLLLLWDKGYSTHICFSTKEFIEIINEYMSL